MVRNMITPGELPPRLDLDSFLRRPLSGSRASLLYKVPVDQKRANPEAFTPLLYAFGPYHAVYSDLYNNGSDDDDDALMNEVLQDPDNPLLEGEQLKLSTLAALLRPDAESRFHTLIDDIKQKAGDINAQYVQRRGNISHRKLSTLLALDGILMVAATLNPEQQRITPLIYPLARLVLSDAILLENQIPILVLDRALKSVAESEIWSNIAEPERQSVPPSLEFVVIWYCKRASPFHSPSHSPQILSVSVKLRPERPLLAFLYEYVHKQLTTKNEADIANHDALVADLQMHVTRSLEPDGDTSLPSASRLARCGLKFKPCTSRIVFDRRRAVLSLPKITVSDTTVRVLHNLLAYEATHTHPDEYWVVSYVHFMDCLIDTALDAQILINAGVICNKLGSAGELAAKWNALCIAVSCRSTPLDSLVMAKLQKFSRNKWHRWRATFLELYWERQPWLLVSLFAATVIMVLALLQTIFTILSY